MVINTYSQRHCFKISNLILKPSDRHIRNLMVDQTFVLPNSVNDEEMLHEPDEFLVRCLEIEGNVVHKNRSIARIELRDSWECISTTESYASTY